MEFPCPSCQHPLSIRRDLPMGDTPDVLNTLTGVNCPNCGFVPLQSVPDDARDPDHPDERTLSYESQLNFSETKHVGHFSLVRLLGHGGFGSVWLADDVNLGRQVALKLPISRTHDVSNLVHEAQAAAHLRHPNIVSIYEVGTEENQVFIASEYIEGMTLRDLLSAGKPTIAKSVDMLISIAGALEHAHSQGIIHRDVKPANILINTVGQPYVTDFGLAKRVSADQSAEATISSEGQVLGTARYMSPEQASGKTKETDHRADIYAIGVMLFEMLTGHVPFRGNMRAVLHQKIFEDPPSPRALDPSLPKDLETICLKCLERDPGKRYSSTGIVAGELRRFRDGEPILARPISSVERLWRWCRRRPTIAGLLISLFVSLTVGLAGVTFYSVQATHNGSLLRESLYRAQMTLAAEYVGHGDIHALRHSLDNVTRDEAAARLRGFEWYYYSHLAAPFLQVVEHGEKVSDVALSTDGRRLAATGGDRDLHIWNAKDGRLIRTLTPEKGRFRSLVFSPTKGQLVTGGSDGYVRFWNPAKDGDDLQHMKHGPPVAFVCLSPNGRTLLAAGAGGAIRLWDVDDETLLAEIPTGKSGTQGVRYSPDGKWIVIATADGRVRLRDVESNEVVKTFEPNPSIEAFALSDDCQTLVTGSYTGTLRVWSTADATLRYTQESNFGRIGDLEFLPDSSLLSIVSTSGELSLFDVADRRLVRSVRSHYLTEGVLARSQNGRCLAVGSGEGSVKLIDTERFAQPDVCWHDAHIRGLQFLDSERLISMSGDGALKTWTIADLQGQTLLEPGGATTTLMTSHPGAGLMAIATADPALRICDLKTAQVVHTPELASTGIADMQFSPSGEWLALAQRDSSIQLIAVDAPAVELCPADEAESPPMALEFMPDGSRLYIARRDGRISAVDMDGHPLAEQSFTIPDVPRALEVCPTSGTLAVGAESGMIHLWDMADQKLRTTIRAHASRINDLQVLPNGTTVVSGGRDRELRLWDSVSGELITALASNGHQVFCIAAAPDGESIASGDLDGAVRLWRAPRTQD